MSAKLKFQGLKNIYDMGNSYFADSLDDAMEAFLKREFPDILRIEDVEFQCVIFVPRVSRTCDIVLAM